MVLLQRPAAQPRAANEAVPAASACPTAYGLTAQLAVSGSLQRRFTESRLRRRLVNSSNKRAFDGNSNDLGFAFLYSSSFRSHLVWLTRGSSRAQRRQHRTD